MHPSIYFSFWLVWVLLTQVLPAELLAAVLAAGLFFLPNTAKEKFRQLVMKSRWILLTLFLTFLLMTPGERIFHGFPLTEEGLAQGLVQMARLLSVLMAVAWLVSEKSTAWILSALLGFVEALPGQKGHAFVVRLSLTLNYATQSEDRRDWKALLSDASMDDGVERDLSLQYPRNLDLAHASLTVAERILAGSVLMSGLFLLLVVQ